MPALAKLAAKRALNKLGSEPRALRLELVGTDGCRETLMALTEHQVAGLLPKATVVLVLGEGAYRETIELEL